jgi:hypothetical protein
MNERIRELAEQAQGWADAQAPCARYVAEEHEYFYEKFAELIVEECARIVTRDAASVIFEHFDLEY